MFLKAILLAASLLLGLNSMTFEAFFSKPKRAASLSSSPHLVESLEYRVGFDLGSGNLKMQASWVDPASGRIVEIAETETTAIPVREAIDRDPNGNIPDNIVQQLHASLQTMQQRAAAHGNVDGYVGGATEAYRIAKNGQEVLDGIERELGISMFLLSQNEEAVLGYDSLLTEGHLNNRPDAILWENGGGSTQISRKTATGFESYNRPIGKVPMKNFLIQKLQGKDTHQAESPNPISQRQAAQAIAWVKEQFRDVPSWLSADVEVIGISAMFPNVQKGSGKMEFTKGELLELIDQRIGKTDAELSPNRDPSSVYMVSDLLFLYGVMDALGIEEVHCPKMKGPGSTSGLLIDSTKWNSTV